MNWTAWIRNASLGLVAFALVDFVERKPVAAGDWEAMAALASRWALGAALGAAYARFVPVERWGLKSGVAFAQLPVLGVLRQALSGNGHDNGASKGGLDWAAELACWGGLAGLLIRYLGAEPGAEADQELVLRLPTRV